MLSNQNDASKVPVAFCNNSLVKHHAQRARYECEEEKGAEGVHYPVKKVRISIIMPRRHMF